MENLKIRVANEAESREAQELFFELGYDFYFGGKIYCNTLGLVTANKEGLMANIELDGFEYKEITLPELRGMVLSKNESLNDKVASAEAYRQAEVLPFIDDEPRLEFATGIELDLIAERLDLRERYAGETDVGYRYALQRYVAFSARPSINDEPNQETIDAMDSEAEAESFATADELFASLEPLTNAEKYPHYFKSVKHLDEVDVYAVMDLFDVQNQAVGHAVKKLLVGGKRGAKNYLQDIVEARDTLNRAIQILEKKNG